jgi:O-antigen/teichoic acid export membrane protein
MQLRQLMLSVGAESLALPTGVLTAAYLTRTLRPDEYALLSIAGGLISWLQWTIAAVWSRPAVKSVASAEQPLAVAAVFLRLYAWSGIAAAVATLLFATPIAGLLSNADLATPLRLYAVEIAVFALTQGYRSVNAGLGDFASRARGSAARWLARLALIVLFVSLGAGVQGAILGSIAASLVDLLVNCWKSPVPVRLLGSIPSGLIPGASPLLLNGILLRLFERMDLMLLSGLGIPAIAVGGYGAAQNIAIVGSIVTGAVSPMLLQTVSRALREGRGAEGLAVATQGVRWTLALIPTAMAVAVCASLPAAIFGAQFRFVAPVLGLLLLCVPFTILLSLLQVTLIAMDRSRPVLAITVVSLLAASTAHFLSIPVYGPLGAAAVTLAATAAACLASAWAAAQGGLPLPWRTACRSAVACTSVVVVWMSGWLDSLADWQALSILLGLAVSMQCVLGEYPLAEIRELWQHDRRD